MIKAEVVEYPGAEVPNWVNKCKAVLTSGPALGVIALAAVTLLALYLWRGHHTGYADQTGVQSRPDSSTSLQVVPADALAAPAAILPGTAAPAANAPVGPAPATSLNSLQSTGGTQNNVEGISQGLGQAVQAAGSATVNSLQNLDL